MKAKFSDCGKYRYLLWEIWDDTKPVLAWCLFNPSKAGATEGDQVATDQTWIKGIGFSKRLGYGGQVFCNPYAFVSTDPKGLKTAGYPMGDGKVVCAWGALGRKLYRPIEVLALIRHSGFTPMALGFTADGLPRHPLMLGYDTPLVPL